MKTRTRLVLLFLCICITGRVYSQSNGISLHEEQNRILLVAGGGGAAYLGSMVILNQYWYANYPKSSFHFFNDNKEWLQMDKCGHFFTSYYEGYYGYRMLKWAGVNDNKAILFGGTWGILFQTPIEVMDGFSSEWGFSWGDETANVLGTLFFIVQQKEFGTQRIQPKFSFWPSDYTQYRPDELGSGFPETLIKDYNAQTYWLSTSIDNYYPNHYVPTYVNFALGYGADGMIGGYENPAEVNGMPVPHFNRQRQFYLSFDLNLANIVTKNQGVNTALQALSFIKMPSPTLEWHEGKGLKFHVVYF